MSFTQPALQTVESDDGRRAFMSLCVATSLFIKLRMLQVIFNPPQNIKSKIRTNSGQFFQLLKTYIE